MTLLEPFAAKARPAAPGAHALARAMHEFHCWRGDPIATLAPALAEPDAIDARLLQCWLLVLGTEPSGQAEARAVLDGLDAGTLDHRQRSHVDAIDDFIDGEWTRAGRRLEDLSLAHPTDALALQAGHLVDYYRGDAHMLRERVLRALPHWHRELPGYHALLGMAAFGAGECGDFAEAERLGRLALELEPLDAWAHHAVAHGHEMRGDSAAGCEWMRARGAEWGPPSFLAVHNAWHWALFLIDQGRLDEALAVYDQHVRGDGSRLLVDLVDASALLLRLRLAGCEPGDRWQPVLEDWSAVLAPGDCLFNDLHAAWAALGAGRVDRIEALRRAHEQAARRHPGERAALSAAFGVPLMDALLALAGTRPAIAVGILRELRPRLHAIGGSRAQRELVELVLIEAALRAGEASLARGLIDARRLLRMPRPERAGGVAPRVDAA